jgi:hypothetical protein
MTIELGLEAMFRGVMPHRDRILCRLAHALAWFGLNRASTAAG